MKHVRKLILITIFSASIFLLNACSTVFGVINVEEASHTVVLKENEFEIREYHDLLLAETLVDSDYKEASSQGFRRIAGYIFGNNKDPKNPEESIDIAMTAPVLQKKDKNGWKMSFVMPKKHSLETLPSPNNNKVNVTTNKAMKVAVIRYSGELNEDRIEEHRKKLEKWIKKNNYKTISSPVSAGYNPPWTLPFLRRNEVMIEIK